MIISRLLRRRRPAASLQDRRRYEAQIERLHEKHALSRRMLTMKQAGVPLAAFVRDRPRLARLLAASVTGGSYLSRPARVRHIVADGKERRVFSYRLSDAIVHGVVADVLVEAMESRMSSRVFSYRKGVSRWTAVSEFAAYLRAHRRAHRDPRARGIYVIRRDVAAYADSIPMGDGSRVWEIVRECLDDQADGPLSPEQWRLIERAVRPEFSTRGRRGHAVLRSGVATGQPIACALFNLYLGDVDCAAERFAGGFYARYSDDILFAHPDAAMAREAAEAMAHVVHGLGLKFEPGKAGDYFLTRPGRPSAAWPEAKGTSSIAFLGTRISADGQVSLKPETVRAFFADLEERARAALHVVEAADVEERGRLVCAVLNRCLDPDARRDGEQGPAALLLHAVTDRAQLSQVDYRLARLVAAILCGDPSVRAFRHVPYRRIRGEWRLRSLLHARNRWN